MIVKVMESNSPPLREGSQVRRVHENGTEFMIDCEDGTTLSLQLIEPGNSISVRDKDGAAPCDGGQTGCNSALTIFTFSPRKVDNTKPSNRSL
jgi:hypothetical protein